MHVKIKNWRCIKGIEFDLSRINIFLGQNATGKSSLAYALYFFSKSARLGVKKTLDMLYNNDIKKIVRIEGEKPCYPAEIAVNDWHITLARHYLPTVGNIDSPWSEEYLLPSIRVACLQILKILQENLQKESVLKSQLAEKFNKKLEDLPLPSQARAFLYDLDKAISKFQISISDKIGYIIKVDLLLPYLTLEIMDSYTGLILTPENAPDGKTDEVLIDFILSRASNNSLIVIEEPEIYKNPIFQFEMMKKISELTISKELTVVMTTHSEIIPLSIAKLVGNGIITKDDVKIYYLTRNKEEPWTKIQEIKVYDDGTLEELPDSEKVTALLF